MFWYRREDRYTCCEERRSECAEQNVLYPSEEAEFLLCGNVDMSTAIDVYGALETWHCLELGAYRGT
jgi:hypothetical protein